MGISKQCRKMKIMFRMVPQGPILLFAVP